MIRLPTMRRRAFVPFVALALALAACGGDDGGGEAAAASGSVTVDHLYGSTTIERTPRRVVSLNNQWTDLALALDLPLVGAALDPGVETGRYPWQDLPGDVEDIEVSDAVPFEAVAALQPDVILASWGAFEQSDYDRLSELAPTIPLLGEEDVDTWQDMATVAGEIFSEEEGAAALIADADEQAAALAAELPGLEGKTYALANYVPGDAIYVVADPEDGAATLFAQIGLQIDPDLLALADGAAGRVTLSLERVGELDADLLILLTNGADPNEIPGYTGLPAVQSGAVSVLDVATITGLNTPSPISVPYALEAIRPALDAADAG